MAAEPAAIGRGRRRIRDLAARKLHQPLVESEAAVDNRGMHALTRAGIGVAFVCAQPGAQTDVTSAEPARAIDFAKVDRKIGTLPETLDARYGLFLFGTNGGTRVWAVLDKSDRSLEYFDRLSIDLDADGDLTDDGEQFAGQAEKRTIKGKEVWYSRFEIGAFVDPATGAKHEAFKLTWTSGSVRFQMKWRGEALTLGTFGPANDLYVNFAKTPAEAPIFVPGWDRPLAFQQWLSATLAIGQANNVNILVGNRGSTVGAFTCVDEEFLPPLVPLHATLIYTDVHGKEKRVRAKLTERC